MSISQCKALFSFRPFRQLVPGEGADFDSKNCIDLGDLTGLRTLEVKGIPCTEFKGLNVLCRDLESVVFNRSRVSSIEVGTLGSCSSG